MSVTPPTYVNSLTKLRTLREGGSQESVCIRLTMTVTDVTLASVRCRFTSLDYRTVLA